MTDDTCRYPSCDDPAGKSDRDDYNTRFCSARCEVRYEHIEADARDARRTEKERARSKEGRL